MWVKEGDSEPQERALLLDPEWRRMGDLFMSLIHACELNGASPFDYLIELQRHAAELKGNPAEWGPWNYRDTLARIAKTTAA